MKDVGTKFERGICISNLVLVLLLSMKVGWCFKFGLKENQRNIILEEVIEDEKCINDDNEPKPGQFFTWCYACASWRYSSYWRFLFCSKVPCPSKVPGKEILLQNAIFISIYAVLNWHMMIAIEKPVLLLFQIMSLPTWETMLLVRLLWKVCLIQYWIAMQILFLLLLTKNKPEVQRKKKIWHDFCCF